MAFGGGNVDDILSVKQTYDSGYIFTGQTSSYGAGLLDIWVVRLDATGTILWQKIFGGSGYTAGNAIIQTSDGGYIALGNTDVYGAGNTDIWVLKLDANGNCGSLGTDNTAVTQNSSCSVISPSISVNNSNCNVINTNCTITDTNCIVNQQAMVTPTLTVTPTSTPISTPTPTPSPTPGQYTLTIIRKYLTRMAT
jgi:hypothetical protein